MCAALSCRLDGSILRLVVIVRDGLDRDQSDLLWEGGGFSAVGLDGGSVRRKKKKKRKKKRGKRGRGDLLKHARRYWGWLYHNIGAVCGYGRR